MAIVVGAMRVVVGGDDANFRRCAQAILHGACQQAGRASRIAPMQAGIAGDQETFRISQVGVQNVLYKSGNVSPRDPQSRFIAHPDVHSPVFVSSRFNPLQLFAAHLSLPVTTIDDIAKHLRTQTRGSRQKALTKDVTRTEFIPDDYSITLIEWDELNLDIDALSAEFREPRVIGKA